MTRFAACSLCQTLPARRRPAVPPQRALAFCSNPVASTTLGHDAENPLLEIGTRYPGHTSQWRSYAEFARPQQTLGIDLPVTTPLQDFFVASALAFLHQPPAQPPDQGVKPEEGFNHHVNRGGQIVATAGVTYFVSENRFQVCIVQVLGDAFGQN